MFVETTCDIYKQRSTDFTFNDILKPNIQCHAPIYVFTYTEMFSFDSMLCLQDSAQDSE